MSKERIEFYRIIRKFETDIKIALETKNKEKISEIIDNLKEISAQWSSDKKQNTQTEVLPRKGIKIRPHVKEAYLKLLKKYKNVCKELAK